MTNIQTFSDNTGPPGGDKPALRAVDACGTLIPRLQGLRKIPEEVTPRLKSETDSCNAHFTGGETKF